jgi:error-prone DNA polymerase
MPAKRLSPWWCWPRILNGYGNLCQFITAAARFGQRHLPPGLGCITGQELQDCLVLLCPERKASDAQLEAMGRWTLTHFTGRCWIGVDLVRRLDDELWLPACARCRR